MIAVYLKMDYEKPYENGHDNAKRKCTSYDIRQSLNAFIQKFYNAVISKIIFLFIHRG